VILVDSSVWIAVLRARRPLVLGSFVDFDDVVTCLPVAGRTVRSSVDCLIAACALRSDLEVLHRDHDYAALAAVSGLRQRTI
jgi:predicted nucleic acid-binding protein